MDMLQQATQIQRYQSSCTECKRRKQKCDRIWPCFHCKSRSVPAQCMFITKKPNVTVNKPLVNPAATAGKAPEVGRETPQAGSLTTALETSKKRARDNSSHDDDSDHDNVDHADATANSALVRSDNLDNLEFSQHFGSLGAEAQIGWLQVKRHQDDEYSTTGADCPALQEALNVLPKRRETVDTLVMSFFVNVNPHYGLIHKSEFVLEYSSWWKKRTNNEPLPVPWTCLLLMVCACACQHLPLDQQEKLEEQLGATCQEKTESYHYRTRCLYASIPIGRYHRNNVMWLLHSTYWYKAEAMFMECCHVFNTAVREAQELEFHREEISERLPNFEREMRRRAWCVIDSWDWQIASGLGRGTIIDHSNCNAHRPSLTLEPDGEFSPLMHMNMQSELIHKLAKRFGSPSKITTYSDIMEYKAMIDEWMKDFPPIFALDNPDTSHDEEHGWIEYHRHYNYTMGFMLILNPFRVHMKETITDKTSEELLELRTIAVDVCLRIVDVLDNWLEFLTFRDGRFHFIIFSLVDSVTVLADMVRNDEAGTVPRRDDIYRAVKNALVLQRRLLCLSTSAKLGFRIIQRTTRQLFRAAPQEHLTFLQHEDDAEDAHLALAIANPMPYRALMNVVSIQSADAGTRHQAATKDQAQARNYEPIVQPVEDVEGVVPVGRRHDEATALPLDSIRPIVADYQETTGSDYAAALAEYFESSSSDYIAPPKHVFSTSSDYALAMVPSYATEVATTTIPHHSVISSAYIESVIPSSIPSAAPLFVEDTSLVHYTTPYVPDFATDFAIDYAAAALPNYAATMSSIVAPESYPCGVSTSRENFAYIPVTNTVTTLAPFTVPTAHDALAAYTMGNDSGLYTAPESYYAPAPHITLTNYDAPAPYTSPDSQTSSESYHAPVLYHASAPPVIPASYGTTGSYASPESQSSSESYNVPVAYQTPAPGATSIYYERPEAFALIENDPLATYATRSTMNPAAAPFIPASHGHVPSTSASSEAFEPYHTPPAYGDPAGYSTYTHP